jgi:hypothetical protein
MTTHSEPYEKEQFGVVILDTADTEATNSFQKSRTQLADDFLLWYAQRRPLQKGEPGPRHEPHWDSQDASDPEDEAWMWMSGSAEVTNEPHPSKTSKYEVIPNKIENLSTPSSNSARDWKDWGKFDYYYDCDKTLRPTKIRTRKWKFSTPPTLRHVGENHTQKLASRTKARNTIRQTSDISWGDGATTWMTDISGDNSLDLLDNSSNTLQANDFKTLFSDRTWGETQLTEIDPTFKKYRTYQPTLLRWCCTAT